MVRAVAMAAARLRQQEAVERQEAALAVQLQQPQNPLGNSGSIIARNFIAGAIDQELDPPNTAFAAVFEGQSNYS